MTDSDSRMMLNQEGGLPKSLSHAKNTPQAERTAARDRVRSLRRDEHEEVRQRTAARMATESGQRQFDRRSGIAETPFGDLKGVLGLRQFRHRGLKKVDQECRWSCLSLNVKNCCVPWRLAV